MTLEQLYAAVDLVRGSCFNADARTATQLRTYPVLIAAARLPARDATEAYLRTAALAYAWMSEPLRLDPSALRPAIDAFEAARDETAEIDPRVIDPIASSLSSLVGASRVLHLANPGRFPFWDEAIERFRLGEEPTPYHMGQARNYLAFIDEIRELVAHPLFLTFHNDFCTAYQARLQRQGIPPYPLTEPKVIESAIFELTGP